MVPSERTIGAPSAVSLFGCKDRWIGSLGGVAVTTCAVSAVGDDVAETGTDVSTERPQVACSRVHQLTCIKGAVARSDLLMRERQLVASCPVRGAPVHRHVPC
jgi:hypothetical protein